jgi:hypothetical protein
LLRRLLLLLLLLLMMMMMMMMVVMVMMWFRYSGMAVSEAGAWALAVLSVAHKALRAQRFTTTVWTAVSLWLLLLLSELRIVNQVCEGHDD